MAEVKNNIIKEQYFSKDNTFFTVAKTNPKDLVEKEIGDSKVPDKFIPQQKITRWDNEVNVSIRLVQDEKKPTVLQDGDVIKWEGKKVDAHFYDVSDVSEGASEFEIILKEKPQTNVVSFTINTKGVDFIYQPALTEEEIAEGTQRDENVVGSYAVYASEEKINRKGGTEYKCGKVGHIYRPKIIDSAGNETWGELNIYKDLLTVTIPQAFLDTAVYPVHHAAGLTFGYTTWGGSAYSVSANYAVGGKFTSPSDAAAGVNIIMHLYKNATLNVKGLLVTFSDLNIVSNGVGNAVAIPANTSEWFTSGFSSSPVINPSTDYILMVIPDNSVSLHYDSTGSGYRDSSNSYTTPENLVSATSNTNKYSIYATYTAEEAEYFGKTDDGTNQTNITEDRIMVSSATPLSNGTLTRLNFRCWVASTSTTGKAVVYSDNSGQPGDLLAVGDEVTISNTTLSIISLPFSGAAQISLSASTTYWIGIHVKDPGATNFSFKRDNTSNATKRTTQAYTSNPQDPFGTPTNDAGPLAIYGTYTLSEGTTSVEVIPTVQTTSVSLISPTVTALMSATVTASVLVCGMALNTPTVTAQRAVEVTPTVQTASASLIAPTVTAQKTVTISANTLTATASAISPTVTATRSATISAQSQTLACGIIEPVITALRTVTVSPACQELTITLNSPTARTPEKSLIIYGIAL